MIMEQREFEFKGTVVNGIDMLIGVLVMVFGSIGLAVFTGIVECWWACALFCVLFVVSLVMSAGFVQVEPNEARVMMFFGKYRGTFTRVGYYWVNPFINTKKLSLRARNLDVEPIKVNDKSGNPIMIGLVLVWKLKDTYKAVFEIDSQTMAGTATDVNGASVQNMMRAFESFVKVQSDAALRQVAGNYAYDDTDNSDDSITLRGGAEEINKELEDKLTERLSIAGIEIVEARINYLAYAPEIAAAMLRRQQATAVIMAREKIVEGAVSMVKMALDKLSEENVVNLDDNRKAQMVSNLLVVLCGDDNAQPVVSTGSAD